MHTTLHHETGYVLTLTISDINGKCKEEGTGKREVHNILSEKYNHIHPWKYIVYH